MDLRWSTTKIVGSAVIGLAHRSGGSGPPLIGRRDARILARRELGRINIVERILLDLRHLFDLSGGAVPSGWFGLIVLGVLAAALIIVIFAWVRPTRHRRERQSAVIGNKTRTAQDYRKSAARLAAAGDFSAAIIDGVRAIAAELEERGILPPRLGRTADELAVEAAVALPALAADLRSVTGLFDDIRYGERPGTEAGYQLVSRLDAAVRTTPTVVGGTRSVETIGPAVPR
ncbi:MAG TPA: DUF4129 domain-containing protein [Streptosporangiaceae bacterium]|nr:DUF4129 domain-containing protein [Streptosporangiaceae bacterium]